MVANFWNASPQGSEMMSTLVPGLAASNLPTIDFSVSVRSGLVITSTSFSVVSASARARHQRGGECRDKKLFSLSFPSSLVCFRFLFVGGGGDRRLQVTPQRLGSLEADMEAHGPRMDAERHRGIGLGLLLQHDFAGHDQALMAAPADAELEQLAGGRRTAGCRCRRGRRTRTGPTCR